MKGLVLFTLVGAPFRVYAKRDQYTKDSDISWFTRKYFHPSLTGRRKDKGSVS